MTTPENGLSAEAVAGAATATLVRLTNTHAAPASTSSSSTGRASSAGEKRRAGAWGSRLAAGNSRSSGPPTALAQHIVVAQVDIVGAVAPRPARPLGWPGRVRYSLGRQIAGAGSRRALRSNPDLHRRDRRARHKGRRRVVAIALVRRHLVERVDKGRVARVEPRFLQHARGPLVAWGARRQWRPLWLLSIAITSIALRRAAASTCSSALNTSSDTPSASSARRSRSKPRGACSAAVSGGTSSLHRARACRAHLGEHTIDGVASFERHQR